MSDPILGLVALGMLFVGLVTGFPMAFTFIFIALVFGYIGIQEQVFFLLNYQIFGLMKSTILAAVPLFLFMGYILEESGLMERVFHAMRMMLGSMRGGLYLVILIIAIIFAAATGIVGASVTVLGVMAAPIMKSSGYDTKLSAGSLSAGGTLGILMPPSIMLIVMGPIIGVPVATMFTAAIVPAAILGTAYIIYTLARSSINPELGPPIPKEELEGIPFSHKLSELILGVVPVGIVIFATLGVIILGITTPTDAAATGGFASLLLALAYRRLNWAGFKSCVFKTLKTSSFIMFLIAAANFFGAVFSRLGSAELITQSLLNSGLPTLALLILILAIILVLGSPLEWIPIVLVIVPIFLPAIHERDINLVWFGILVAVTLQTAWLTPPLALAAYFLKGVVPDWSLGKIYAGMLQFVVIQIIVVLILLAFPQLVLWLPSLTSG